MVQEISTHLISTIAMTNGMIHSITHTLETIQYL